MITSLVMPQVTITSEEVKLISWLKKPGDPVKRGDSLVEVETEKATVEIESYVDGYLRVANFPNGAIVPLEAVIAILSSTPDEKIDELQSTDLPKAEEVKLEAMQGNKRDQQAARKDNKGRLDITPVAKRLAEDHHIDIDGLIGTGPDGRIIRADVEAAIKHNQVSDHVEMKSILVQPSTGQTGGLSNMRNAIAQRTALSKATIPHYYVSVDIDMGQSMDWLSNLKEIATKRSVDSPTITDLIIWVCGKILARYPLLNGSWMENGPVLNPEINIGMVVGLEEGLIVPIFHNVGGMSLATLTQASTALKLKARKGGLTSSELTGGTFTISNLGMYGVSSFIAVINPPQSAILALGAIRKRAVVDENDNVVVRPILTATLSIDHRMIDGILAAKFLSSLKEALERLSTLLFDY